MDDFEPQYLTKIVKFSAITTVKRKSLGPGEVMDAQDKADSKDRKNLWLSPIKALWYNSGLFHLQAPVHIALTEMLYETLVAKFAKLIFEEIFYSVSRIVYNGSELNVISLESKYFDSRT